jgi:hypothetical protein
LSSSWPSSSTRNFLRSSSASITVGIKWHYANTSAALSENPAARNGATFWSPANLESPNLAQFASGRRQA